MSLLKSLLTRESIAAFLLIFCLSSVTAIHYTSVNLVTGEIVKQSCGKEDYNFQQLINNYLSYLDKDTVPGALKSRPIIPILLIVINKSVERLPIGDIYGLTFFGLEFLTTMLLLYAVYLFSKKLNIEYSQRLLAVAVFSALTMSTLKDIPRVGDQLAPALLFLGISLVAFNDKLPSVKTTLLFIPLFVLATMARFDLALLICLTIFLAGVFKKNSNQAIMSLLYGLVSVLTYMIIAKYLNLTNMTTKLLYPHTPDKLLFVDQIVRPSNWFILGSFVNILIIVPFIYWKNFDAAEKATTVSFAMYNLSLLFVGHMSEYRGWLPICGLFLILGIKYFFKSKSSASI